MQGWGLTSAAGRGQEVVTRIKQALGDGPHLAWLWARSCPGERGLGHGGLGPESMVQRPLELRSEMTEPNLSPGAAKGTYQTPVGLLGLEQDLQTFPVVSRFFWLLCPRPCPSNCLTATVTKGAPTIYKGIVTATRQ